MVGGLLSNDGELDLPRRYLPDLLACHDEYPKVSCGYSSTAPSEKEALSDR